MPRAVAVLAISERRLRRLCSRSSSTCDGYARDLVLVACVKPRGQRRCHTNVLECSGAKGAAWDAGEMEHGAVGLVGATSTHGDNEVEAAFGPSTERDCKPAGRGASQRAQLRLRGLAGGRGQLELAAGSSLTTSLQASSSGSRTPVSRSTAIRGIR